MKMRDLDIVRRTSLLMAASACLAVWPQPAAAQSRAQEAAVLQYSPADVRAAVTRLRTVVQDRFTTETDLESARAELQALVVRADELAAKDGQRADATGPAAAAQLEIRQLLAAIDGRLSVTDPSARAVDGRDVTIERLSAKVFGSPDAYRDILPPAQSDLRDQMRTTPTDTARTEALIVELSVAEERLAWEAGWPFMPDEVAELQGVLLEFAKLRDQAGKGGGAGRASDLIKGLEARLGTTLEQIAKRPESSASVFTQLRRAYDEIAREGGVSTVNDIDRRIGDVYARRRWRGESVINARLSEEAASVGREAPRPFAIHRPTTRTGQREVDGRIAELVATEIGLPLQTGGPALVRLSIGTRPFDDTLKAALAGRQQ